MLIRQGSSRTLWVDLQLACALAAIAGAVNTAVFQAVGFFAANMTGNVSTMAIRFSLNGPTSASFYLTIVLLFVLGSAVSTLIINFGRRRRVRGIYAFNIIAESALMAALGGLVLILPSNESNRLLVLGLSFLMGLQNAVVTRISDARIRTTHVSGMITDIGIGIGTLLDISLGQIAGGEAHEVRSRLLLHSATVGAFVIGGIVGILAYQIIGLALLFACAGALVAMALPAAINARQ